MPTARRLISPRWASTGWTDWRRRSSGFLWLTKRRRSGATSSPSTPISDRRSASSICRGRRSSASIRRKPDLSACRARWRRRPGASENSGVVMPVAIIGAVVAAGVGAATGATLFGLTVWETFFARIAFSLIVSELSSALSPKAKSPSQNNLASQAQQRTQQITQAVGPSEVVYGTVLKSGTVVYASNTQTNAYTHIVIVVADHEVAGLDEVLVNSDVVPNDYLDAGGNVITGKYSVYLRIKKHLGTTGQPADSALVAEDSAWTSAHKLEERAYIYIRYKRNQTVFPGAPNFAVIVRGKKIFDSDRKST